jgi:cobalt-zinc-cadmium efflux system membrane fusion protein
MIKRFLLIILCAALFWWCSPAHDHDHAEGEGHSGHAHEQSDTHAQEVKEAHVHAEGEECTGHDHEPVDTQAQEVKEGHVHAEGEECTGHDHEPVGTQAQEVKETHDHLYIPPAKVKQWGITFSHPVERQSVQRVHLTGTVAENEGKTFLVNSLIEGTVTKIYGDIGDSVKQGQPLCQLNSSELLEKKTRYIQAFQQQRLEKENYLRAKNLFEIKAIEKKELTSRESAYKIALAEYVSLESELQSVGLKSSQLKAVKKAVVNDKEAALKTFLSPYCIIPAPAGGIVMNRDLKLGQRIEKDRTIFLVSDLSTVWVLFDALEKDFPLLTDGAAVSVVSDTFPRHPFDGTVARVLQQLDPKLRTVKVRVVVDNRGNSLKPGMYVKGTITRETGEAMPAVPPAALVKISGINGLFLKDGDGFKFKPLKVDATDADGYVFARGLHDHDEVVVDGAFYLKAEYELARGGGTTGDHGHAH